MKKTSRKPTAPQRPSMHREDGEAPLLLYLARALVRILPLTLAVGLVLSLAAAVFAYSRPDPESMILPLALCITLLLSLLGGWLTFRTCRRACLLCGLAFGASLVLLFCIIAYLLPYDTKNVWPAGIRWALRGGMIAFSVFGALMGSYAPHKKRKKKRH